MRAGRQLASLLIAAALLAGCDDDENESQQSQHSQQSQLSTQQSGCAGLSADIAAACQRALAEISAASRQFNAYQQRLPDLTPEARVYTNVQVTALLQQQVGTQTQQLIALQQQAASGNAAARAALARYWQGRTAFYRGWAEWEREQAAIRAQGRNEAQDDRYAQLREQDRQTRQRQAQLALEERQRLNNDVQDARREADIYGTPAADEKRRAAEAAADAADAYYN